MDNRQSSPPRATPDSEGVPFSIVHHSRASTSERTAEPSCWVTFRNIIYSLLTFIFIIVPLCILVVVSALILVPVLIVSFCLACIIILISGGSFKPLIEDIVNFPCWFLGLQPCFKEPETLRRQKKWRQERGYQARLTSLSLQGHGDRQWPQRRQGRDGERRECTITFFFTPTSPVTRTPPITLYCLRAPTQTQCPVSLTFEQTPT